jgi:hypothetical protein
MSYFSQLRNLLNASCDDDYRRTEIIITIHRHHPS